MNTPDQRAAYIAGLRALADAMENNPGIPLPLSTGTTQNGAICFPFDAREELAAAAKAMPCNWAKGVSENGVWFELSGILAGGLYVELYAAREQVCTRKVTGVEEREVEEVTPAVTRTVVKQVEVVEWDCGPLLPPRPGGGGSATPPQLSTCGPGTCTCGAHVSASGVVTAAGAL